MAGALITGGTGFIGTALAKRLADHDCYDFVLAVDPAISTDHPAGINSLSLVRHVRSDVRNFSQSNDGAGIDTVFHLAALKHNNSKGDAGAVLDNNLAQSVDLLRWAAVRGIRRVVFSSSLYVYGAGRSGLIFHEKGGKHPETVYGWSKSVFEDILATFASELEVEFNIARLFFVYGPGQELSGGYTPVIVLNHQRMRRGLPLIINGDGSQVLDYVHIDDVTDALATLGSSDVSGQTVNISTGVGTSIRDLVEAMARHYGYEDIDFAPADWTHGTTRVGANDLALEKFGWSPRIGFTEGLFSTLTHLDGARD